jgi:hypothetical protein
MTNVNASSVAALTHVTRLGGGATAQREALELSLLTDEFKEDKMDERWRK